MSTISEPPYSKGESGVTGNRTYHWYRERPSSDGQTAGPVLTTSFQQLVFTDDEVGDGNFLSTYVELVNDASATDNIYVSWNGVNIHWTVKPGEIKTFPHMRERFIWLKGSSGGEPYRVSAW